MCALVLAASTALAQPQPANWLETRIAIEELADAGNNVEALALGDRLLQLAAEEFGESDVRVAEAHLLLARVQRATGDHTAAEDEILAAIDIYEAAVGGVSPSLIEPFLALGDNYNEAGDYSAAIAAWGEARAIGRRNFGLLNEDQLPIIDKITEAAEKIEEVQAARDLQEESLILTERIHGPDSRDALEARFKYEGWLREHEYLDEWLRMCYQIERTITDHFDSDPIMLTRVFRERARGFRDQNDPDPQGIGGLSDALELLEAMPEPPPLLMAELLVDIGDWHVRFDRGPRQEYVRAWRLLGSVENGDELRKKWFSDLYEIDLLSFSRRGISDDPEDPAGYVTIEFTVDVTGNTRDVEILESDPPGLKDASALGIMQKALFRPGVEDGALVSRHRIYRWDFHYIPLEEDSRHD